MADKRDMDKALREKVSPNKLRASRIRAMIVSKRK